ncbi:MAG: hypothetical protein PHS98_01635 [Bacilli bacterium]|nr:hypothetical protein [Bacilli bacterium]MDD4643695.1 hypothetical protein [Bacilli bacterium]
MNDNFDNVKKIVSVNKKNWEFFLTLIVVSLVFGLPLGFILGIVEHLNTDVYNVLVVIFGVITGIVVPIITIKYALKRILVNSKTTVAPEDISKLKSSLKRDWIILAVIGVFLNVTDVVSLIITLIVNVGCLYILNRDFDNYMSNNTNM